jgi:DNA-binding winged helix-turn-helix (wHTH) protein/tetratricopeptide (TPR) repeat protein
VDVEKETLLRAGEPVALTPKTFQILLVLIRHSQEIVTKDDLLKTVWPDTFVEEANLSRNIFMLRRALGESPQDRKFILTVPGRGYRLAENVRLVTDQQLSLVAANHQKVEVQVTETRPLKWAFAGAAVLVATIAAGSWRLFQHRPALSAMDTVVLADFTNSTGDAVFDDTLRQGMAVQLGQSPYLSLISDERIRHTLGLMGMSADAKLTPELARQVCVRTGSAAVIDGSITRMGSQYVLGLHGANCNTGETLDDEQVQVAKKEDVLNALSLIAGKFRSRAGESLSAIQQHATPLAEATTPSLDALKAYSAAWKVAFSSPQEAILLLGRAIEIDPDFAMAYALQGRLYADIWEPASSQRSIDRAYALRDRASDRERFFIELNYQSLVTGNLKKAQEICSLWAQAYPRDAIPHGELTWINQELGNYDRSIEEARKAIELNADFTPGYNNLAWAYVLSGRLDEAENTLQSASARKLEMPEMLVMRYYIAFLKGDKTAMDRVMGRGQGQPEADDWLTYAQATTEAYRGQLRQANKTTNRAVNLALQANHADRAAMYRAGMAVREAFFGDALEAMRDAKAALAQSKNRDVEWGAALASELAGDGLKSEQLARDLDRRFPEDSYVQVTYLPMLRALAAFHSGDTTQALELLQATEPLDMGVPGSWSGFFGNLYPIYLRGTINLASHHGSGAAPEFQNLINHRSIVYTDPVGALAQLELGRAYSLTGDKARARIFYENFLLLWKDADPQIPVLRQAKNEYARLR